MILVWDICYSGLVLWYVEKNIGDGRDTRLDPWVEGCVLRDWFSKFDGLAEDREVSVSEMYGSNEGDGLVVDRAPGINGFWKIRGRTIVIGCIM